MLNFKYIHSLSSALNQNHLLTKAAKLRQRPPLLTKVVSYCIAQCVLPLCLTCPKLSTPNQSSLSALVFQFVRCYQKHLTSKILHEISYYAVMCLNNRDILSEMPDYPIPSLCKNVTNSAMIVTRWLNFRELLWKMQSIRLKHYYTICSCIIFTACMLQQPKLSLKCASVFKYILKSP